MNSIHEGRNGCGTWASRCSWRTRRGSRRRGHLGWARGSRSAARPGCRVASWRVASGAWPGRGRAGALLARGALGVLAAGRQRGRSAGRGRRARSRGLWLQQREQGRGRERRWWRSADRKKELGAAAARGRERLGQGRRLGP
jgi:hypothetical protein